MWTAIFAILSAVLVRTPGTIDAFVRVSCFHVRVDVCFAIKRDLFRILHTDLLGVLQHATCQLEREGIYQDAIDA